MVLPPPLTILIWADVNRPAEVLELQAGLPDAQQKFLDFLLPGVLYLSRAGCARLAGLAGAPGHPSTGSGGEFMPLLVSPNGQDFFRLRPAPEGFHPEDRTDTYDVLLHPSDRTRLAGQASTAQLTVARSCGLPPGVALVRLAIQLERGVQLDESTIEGLTACLEGVVLRAGQMYYLRKCHFLVQELVDSAGALLRQGIFQSTMPPNSLLAYTAVSAYGLPVPSLRPAIQVSVAGVASSPEHLWLAVLPASRPAGGSPHPTLTPSPCAPTPQGALSPGPRPMADAFLAPSTLQRIQRLAGGRVPGSATGACLSTTHEPLSILPDGRVPRQSIRLSPKLQAALGTANASTGFRGKILFQHQLPAVGLLVLCPTGAFHPGHLDAQAAPPSVEASVEAFLSQCDGLFVQQDDIVTLPGPVECRVVEMFRYPCRRPLASGRLVRSTPGSPISEVVVLSRRSGASLPREPGPEHRSELGRRTLQLLCPGAVQVELALALVSAATMASPCSPGECLAPAGLLSGLHAGLLAGDLFLASPDGSVRLRVRTSASGGTDPGNPNAGSLIMSSVDMAAFFPPGCSFLQAPLLLEPQATLHVRVFHMHASHAPLDRLARAFDAFAGPICVQQIVEFEDEFGHVNRCRVLELSDEAGRPVRQSTLRRGDARVLVLQTSLGVMNGQAFARLRLPDDRALWLRGTGGLGYVRRPSSEPPAAVLRLPSAVAASVLPSALVEPAFFMDCALVRVETCDLLPDDPDLAFSEGEPDMRLTAAGLPPPVVATAFFRVVPRPVATAECVSCGNATPGMLPASERLRRALPQDFTISIMPAASHSSSSPRACGMVAGCCMLFQCVGIASDGHFPLAHGRLLAGQPARMYLDEGPRPGCTPTGAWLLGRQQGLSLVVPLHFGPPPRGASPLSHVVFALPRTAALLAAAVAVDPPLVLEANGRCFVLRRTGEPGSSVPFAGLGAGADTHAPARSPTNSPGPGAWDTPEEGLLFPEAFRHGVAAGPWFGENVHIRIRGSPASVARVWVSFSMRPAEGAGPEPDLAECMGDLLLRCFPDGLVALLEHRTTRIDGWHVWLRIGLLRGPSGEVLTCGLLQPQVAILLSRDLGGPEAGRQVAASARG